MLLSKRCPYTNVVNFFDDTEPHIAVGSITKCGTFAGQSGYAWRFYDGGEARSGCARDIPSAERALRASMARPKDTSAQFAH